MNRPACWSTYGHILIFLWNNRWTSLKCWIYCLVLGVITEDYVFCAICGGRQWDFLLCFRSTWVVFSDLSSVVLKCWEILERLFLFAFCGAVLWFITEMVWDLSICRLVLFSFVRPYCCTTVNFTSQLSATTRVLGYISVCI